MLCIFESSRHLSSDFQHRSHPHAALATELSEPPTLTAGRFCVFFLLFFVVCVRSGLNGGYIFVKDGFWFLFCFLLKSSVFRLFLVQQ